MSKRIRTNAIAEVVYQSNKGKKCRPVYILEVDAKSVEFFRISGKYQNKSKNIKQYYFEITDWSKA